MQKLGNRLSLAGQKLWGIEVEADRVEFAYNQNSGMEYTHSRDNNLMESCHEAVGLVTWYRVSPEEWREIQDAADKTDSWEGK